MKNDLWQYHERLDKKSLDAESYIDKDFAKWYNTKRREVRRC